VDCTNLRNVSFDQGTIISVRDSANSYHLEFQATSEASSRDEALKPEVLAINGGYVNQDLLDDPSQFPELIEASKELNIAFYYVSTEKASIFSAPRKAILSNKSHMTLQGVAFKYSY